LHLLCHLREALTRYLQRITPALRRVLTNEPAAAPAVTSETSGVTPTDSPGLEHPAPGPAMVPAS
jgi:hypothetical protein